MGLINLGKKIGTKLKESYEESAKENKIIREKVKQASFNARQEGAIKLAKERERLKYKNYIKEEREKYNPNKSNVNNLSGLFSLEPNMTKPYKK